MNKSFVRKKKTELSQTNELKNAIDAITYDKDNIYIAGTSTLKGYKYASDIDISEYFNRNKDAKFIYNAIKKIVSKLEMNNMPITDIKAGINPDFWNKFNNAGIIENEKLINFDYDITMKDIKNINIDKQIKNELIKLCERIKNGSISNWIEFKNIIKKQSAIRWTPKEINEGYKIINNREIKFIDIINFYPVKIDAIFLYNGFYTEISNIILTYLSMKNKIDGMPFEVNNNKHGLTFDIFEFMNSNPPKLLKALKRIFSLANTYNNYHVINKIVPICKSDIMILSKCASIIDTLILMFDKLPNPPIKEIKTNVDNLKILLSQIIEFNYNEKNIYMCIDAINKSNNKDFIINQLNELYNMMFKIINRETAIYIKKNHIMPLPKKYEP